jgi:hypothetical protein
VGHNVRHEQAGNVGDVDEAVLLELPWAFSTPCPDLQQNTGVIREKWDHAEKVATVPGQKRVKGVAHVGVVLPLGTDQALVKPVSGEKGERALDK